jgi:hypothetical protein
MQLSATLTSVGLQTKREAMLRSRPPRSETKVVTSLLWLGLSFLIVAGALFI